MASSDWLNLPFLIKAKAIALASLAQNGSNR